MAKVIRRIGGSFKPVFLPHWEHLGTERLVMDGTGQVATLPAGTEIFQIVSGGGDSWYNINLGFADITSGILTPQDVVNIIGPLSNLDSLHIYGAAQGPTVYLQYFRETEKQK